MKLERVHFKMLPSRIFVLCALKHAASSRIFVLCELTSPAIARIFVHCALKNAASFRIFVLCALKDAAKDSVLCVLRSAPVSRIFLCSMHSEVLQFQ